MKNNQLLIKWTAVIMMTALFVGVIPAVRLMAADTHTVSFQTVYGTTASEIQVEDGETVSQPSDPYRRNCEFQGWYYETTDESGETVELQWDFSTGVTTDLTLYPMWEMVSDWTKVDENASLRTGGTDVRIMSYNVARPYASLVRGERIKVVIENYQPDIVCLQEFGQQNSESKHWNDIFTEIGVYDSYPMVSYTEDGTTWQQQRLIYNKQTVIFIENVYFDSWNATIGQCAALFELKATGQQFIVASTHWNPNGLENTELDNSNKAVTMITDLRERYNDVPIITAGDYNKYENSIPISNYKENAKMKLAKHDSLLLGFSAGCLGNCTGDTIYGDSAFGGGDMNTYVAKYGQKRIHTIDHIFVDDSIQTLYFDTVIDSQAMQGSDHQAIYADLTFTHQYDNACDTSCSVPHEEGKTCVRDITRTHANHCGEETCQWCGGTSGSLKGATDALAPVIKGATIRKMNADDPTQSIRFECEIPDLSSEGKTVTEIGMISTYYNYIKVGNENGLTADNLVIGAASDETTGKYFREDSVSVGTESALSDGGTFYANVGTVPENRYGFRFVVRVWAKYNDGTTLYSSNTTMTESTADGTIAYSGSMEDAVAVEDGLCSRSVTGLAQEIAKWIYSADRAQEAYELTDIDERILESYNERTGAVSWAKPDGNKMTIADLLSYLSEKSEEITSLKNAWDWGYRGPKDNSSDMVLDFSGLENNH